MNQFGMQMPAARARSGPSVNVYTALLAFSVAGLAVAVFFMYKGAESVAPRGSGPLSVLELHPENLSSKGLQLRD